MRKSTEFLYTLAETDFIKGFSLTEVGAKYGIDRGKFSLYLKAKGIEVINHQNILKFDNTVFDVIDTEEKAYWLGFMFADGYVSSRDNAIELSLKLTDIYHLKKFYSFLKLDKAVSFDNFRCRASISDKHLKQQLIKHGCTPKKSLTLNFPSTIPENMIRHFIRGYFDGDGSLFTRAERNGRVSLQCSLLGTKEFLAGCRNYLQFAKGTYRKNNGSVNTWAVSSSNLKAVANTAYMYKDSTVYLQRKYNIYSQFAVLDRND